MNFKSLNESILSVTNRSVVKEGLLGKLKKKAKRFTQGLTTGGDGPPSPGEELMNARWARGHRTEGDIQRAYMKHKARATVKEEQEYIEMLEFALESIAEELECDVEDLLEDMAQTPQRTRQLASKIDKAEKGKRPGGIGTPEYSDKQYNSTKSGAKKLRGYRKAEKDEKRGVNLFNKEVGSKKLYGRGGRVLKRKIRPNSDTTNG